MAEDGNGARLAIDRGSGDSFLGWIGLTRWNPDYRSASLGYCLLKTAWGHGYATEAGHALLQWGFETLGLNRVQAETDTRNAGSARVLEKLGFVREGTLREDCIVNGEVSDSWVYGLLRRQWQPRPSGAVVSERPPIRWWRQPDGDPLARRAGFDPSSPGCDVNVPRSRLCGSYAAIRRPKRALDETLLLPVAKSPVEP